MRKRSYFVVITALLLLAVVTTGCSRRRNEERTPEAIWTPSAVTGSTQLATPGADILPSPAPVETRVAQPSAAPATRDPNVVVVTEQDVLKAVASGATAQEGANLEGVGVDFIDGKMRLTADRASYQFISVDNLEVIGTLVAEQGKLQMETESVKPRGIVTSFIPTIANQALANYTSRWYVEDVQTYDDRLELRIRP